MFSRSGCRSPAVTLVLQPRESDEASPVKVAARPRCVELSYLEGEQLIHYIFTFTEARVVDDPECLLAEPSPSPASTALATLISTALYFDTTIPRRLKLRSDQSIANISASVSSLRTSIEAHLPASVSNTRSRVRSADKILEANEDRYADTAHVLNVCLQHLAVGDAETEFTEDTLATLTRLLADVDGPDYFQPTSTVVVPAHSDVLHILNSASRIRTRVDPFQSTASHTRWLPRGANTVVTFSAVDSAGDAVHDITLTDVLCTLDFDPSGWDAAITTVDGNVASLSVTLESECADSAALRVAVAGTIVSIKLEVSSWRGAIVRMHMFVYSSK